MKLEFDLHKLPEGGYQENAWHNYIKELTGLPKSPRNRASHKGDRKAGEIFIEDFQGERVIRRYYETVGNQADGMFNFLTFPDTDKATIEFSIYVPKGFCKNVRAGKLPGSLAGKEVVALGDINWQGFASLLMFHTDRDVETGKYIQPKDHPYRDTFTIADYTYCQSLEQGGGQYGAKGGDWRYGEGENLIEFREESWIHIRQEVKLNDYGQSNGYIRSYINSDYPDWVQVFNGRENLTFRRKENPFSICVWEIPSFQGGGSDKVVPIGWKPIEPVNAYFKGFNLYVDEEPIEPTEPVEPSTELEKAKTEIERLKLKNTELMTMLSKVKSYLQPEKDLYNEIEYLTG